MALDGITTELLTRELNTTLSGGRIDKIFMPDKHTVILHIRANGSVKKLLISISPSSSRINITDSTRENPMMPPSFCMLLRKYLGGSRIVAVKNPGYERIVEIVVSTTDELHDVKEMRLVAELMGRYSNLILINQSGKIIDSAIHVDCSVNRVREVMPARIYDYPPRQNKLIPDVALRLLEENKLPVIDEEMGRPISKALLGSIMGLAPNIARLICTVANVDERQPANKLSDSDINNIITTSLSFMRSITDSRYTPAVYFSEDDLPCDYSPFELVGFHHKVSTETISQSIDLYYEKKEHNIDLENKKQRLTAIINTALNHAVRKAEIHRKDYDEGLMADEYKKCGDLILGNSYMINSKSEKITVVDYYEDPPKNITISINPSLNISDNAQEYYKKFRKAKRKFEMSEKYIKDDNLAIEYFRTLKVAASACSCDDDIAALMQEIKDLSSDKKDTKKNSNKNNQGNPNATVGIAKSGNKSSRALREAAKKANMKQKESSRKNEKPLPVRRYESSDGHVILCGRNNIQNDELTFKTADRKDWWFHVKGLPGTHVILKTKPNEDMPSDSSILEAAQTAAFFSRDIMIEEHNSIEGSRAGEIKAEIDYCPVSHVKKIPGARPGMVIYEGYYSIIVNAIEPH